MKRALHGLFVFGQWLGFDILPRHFYSEIPDIRKLRQSKEWSAPYSMIGVAGADVDRQLAFLQQVTERPNQKSRLAYERACIENGAAGYGVAEAQFLFQFIGHVRPDRVIQVGAGVSTSVILQAASAIGHPVRLVCIDPFPTGFLRRLAVDGRITLIDKPVEQLKPGLLADLQSGDLFFVDSTHTLGPAGEVTRLILEWLPCVVPGVYVHFHDIMFPYDYMPDLLDGALFFQHESPLLHAFLCMNDRFEILCSLSMLYHSRRSELIKALPDQQSPQTRDGLTTSRGSIPSSIFLKRKNEHV